MYPKACWILCTPRTGSSVLCELLNNVGAFPVFRHKNMQTTHRGPLEAGQTFNEWPRLYDDLCQFLENPPPYSKMIFHQYVETMAGVAKRKRYDIGWYPEKHDKKLMAEISSKYDSRYARSIFPDLKFV